MQCSVHPVSSFIQVRQAELLPGWVEPVASVLVVLQRAERDLLHRNAVTDCDRNRLRQQFLQFGRQVMAQLEDQGYQAEIFDPRTGLPVYTPSGSVRFDDVAIARSVLNYPVEKHRGCLAMVHPVWGGAVYPSTLVSSAPPSILQAIVNSLMKSLPQSYS